MELLTQPQRKELSGCISLVYNRQKCHQRLRELILVIISGGFYSLCDCKHVESVIIPSNFRIGEQHDSDSDPNDSDGEQQSDYGTDSDSSSLPRSPVRKPVQSSEISSTTM